MIDSLGFGRRIYKYHIYIYVLMVVLSMVVIIIALFQPEWFRYCWFTFGLTSVNNFAKDEFDDYDTQKGLRDHICSHNNIQNFVEDACPEYCQNSENIIVASWLIIGMSMMALGCLSILLTLHFRLLTRGLMQVKYVYVLYLLPIVILISSLIIYIFAGNLYELDNTNKDGFPSNQKPVDFQPEMGLVLMTTATVLVFAQTVFGLIITRRAFQDIPVFESNIEELSKGIDLQELILVE